MSAMSCVYKCKIMTNSAHDVNNLVFKNHLKSTHILVRFACIIISQLKALRWVAIIIKERVPKLLTVVNWLISFISSRRAILLTLN